MRELDRVLRALIAAADRGEAIMLVTVLQVQGSVYRGAGARMVVTQSGLTEGAVSGGCLEADIVARAPAVLAARIPEVVRYDTRAGDDGLLGLGMGCQGVIDLLLEPLDGPKLNDAISLFGLVSSSQQQVTIATLVEEADVHRVGAKVVTAENGSVLAGDPSLLAHPERLAREVVNPAVELLVCGAGGDAIPLARLAAEMGWRVTVLDHRPAFATRERFPDVADLVVANLVEHPEALTTIASQRTMAVVMAHASAHDRAYLQALLHAGARYIGVLGPRRRTMELLGDGGANGLPPQVHSPVGLDLGAETPEEIALAIVAEVAAVAAGRSGGRLRDRAGPIHTDRTHFSN